MILVDSSVWIDYFKGITIRKTNDVIIATFCLENDHSFLFSDKDFVPFVKYLDLNAVLID